MRKINMVKRVSGNHETNTQKQQNVPVNKVYYNTECVPCVTFLNSAVFEDMAAEYGGSPDAYANKLTSMGMVCENTIVPTSDPYSLGFSEALTNTVGSVVMNMVDTLPNIKDIPDSELYKLHKIAADTLTGAKESFCRAISYKIVTCLSNGIYDIFYDILSRYAEKAQVTQSIVFDMMEEILNDEHNNADIRSLNLMISREINEMVRMFTNLNFMEFDDAEASKDIKERFGLTKERESGIYFVRSKMYTLHADIINRIFFIVTNMFRKLVYTNKFFVFKNPNITILAIQDMLTSTHIPCLSNILKSELSKVMNIIVESSVLLLGYSHTEPNPETYDFEKCVDYIEKSRLFAGSKELSDDYNTGHGNFTYCEF